MSDAKHSNEKINEYIINFLQNLSGFELIESENKESIVFDEKEISCIYTFRQKKSDVNIILTISDPLYFCNISFAKSDNKYFSLKDYQEKKKGSNKIEKVFNDFIEEKVSAENYVLKYLEIFKESLQSAEIQKISAGEYWPF